jgi:hypothetical protein
VASGTFGGYVVYAQLWSQIRHGLAVLGWMIWLGLVGAACCWCCGYVVRSEAWRGRPSARRVRPAHAGAGLVEAKIADEVARGIREIERYLSTV